MLGIGKQNLFIVDCFSSISFKIHSLILPLSVEFRTIYLNNYGLLDDEATLINSKQFLQVPPTKDLLQNASVWHLDTWMIKL